MVCTSPEVTNDIRTSAHMSLIQCYELKNNYRKALEHCDWVIDKSGNAVFASRCKIRRPILLFHQGKLTRDDLFNLANKENELYDRIAQIGRHSDLSILERITDEAPPDSKYFMEAQYWKLEYFEHFNIPERAKLQSQFILQNCKFDHVLGWVKRRQSKEKEIAEQRAKGDAVNRSP